MKRFLVFITVVAASSMGLGQTGEKRDPRGPQVSEQQSKVRQELMKLERESLDALKHRDAETLARLQADEYTYTVGQGRFGNKDDARRELSSLDLESISSDLVSLKLYGNVAVMSLHGAMKGTFLGKDMSGEYLETAVWVKRGGRWQVVTTHLSPISKE